MVPRSATPRSVTPRSIYLAFLGLVACGGPRFAERPALDLPTSITERGSRVYIGRVFPLHGNDRQPTYVYERRVDEQPGSLVSTHVTRDLSGSIQIAESATHTADYRLVDYTLHANQLGQTGSIHVGDGIVHFTLAEGDGERTAVERPAGDVVVGPTLVGYLVRRLDALRGGQSSGLRLAVLDRLETIGFRVKAVATTRGLTRLEMRPASLFVSLVVDPIYFTFETATAKLVRLEGRVPPKVLTREGFRDFDARVEYELIEARYR